MDMPFEDIKGRLSDWVRMESIQRQIRLRFRAFLERYKDDAGNEVYKQRINNMCIGMTQPHVHQVMVIGWLTISNFAGISCNAVASM